MFARSLSYYYTYDTVLTQCDVTHHPLLLCLGPVGGTVDSRPTDQEAITHAHQGRPDTLLSHDSLTTEI